MYKRQGADFHIAVIGRHPHLDVIALGGGEAQIARAQRHHAIGQAQQLQHLFGLTGHGFQLFVALLRLGDFDHFDLIELVLADQATGIAAGAARLLAEARAVGAVADGQILAVQDHIAVQVSHGHLGGGNQEGVLIQLVGVLFKLGQLTRAGHGAAGDHVGRQHLGVAVGSMGIHKEVDDRALKTRAQAAIHGKARTADLCRRVEIQDIQIGADIPMLSLINISVLGLVENMSSFRCPDCGKVHAIFGESHADDIAKAHGISPVCRLPINPKLASAVDAGMIELMDENGLDALANKPVSYTHLDVYKRQGQMMSLGFDKAYIMQNSLNYSVSEVLSTYIYKQGIKSTKYSYSAAISLFNNLINLIMLVTVNRISDKLSGNSLF